MNIQLMGDHSLVDIVQSIRDKAFNFVQLVTSLGVKVSRRISV